MEQKFIVTKSQLKKLVQKSNKIDISKIATIGDMLDLFEPVSGYLDWVANIADMSLKQVKKDPLYAGELVMNFFNDNDYKFEFTPEQIQLIEDLVSTKTKPTPQQLKQLYR